MAEYHSECLGALRLSPAISSLRRGRGLFTSDDITANHSFSLVFIKLIMCCNQSAFSDYRYSYRKNHIWFDFIRSCVWKTSHYPAFSRNWMGYQYGIFFF